MLVPYNVDVPMARLPFANWGLIAVTCLVSIVIFIRWHPTDSEAIAEREREAIKRALDKDGKADGKKADEEIQKALREIEKLQKESIPPLSLRWDRLVVLWLFTHLFVHADLFHLIGNMLFLFVFGNAVNAKLGHWQFLVSYLLLGALAGLAWLPFADGNVAVGASGAIMGIVGIFVVLFPRNDVEVFYSLGWSSWLWYSRGWWGTTRVAAYWVVLFYFLCNVVGLIFFAGDSIGYLAHLAGAAGGFALGLVLVRSRVIRSTRYEENLLECLGFQRKEEPRRRKKKKARKRSKDERTVAELLADGNNYDICEEMFRRVLRRNGGEVNAVGLTTEERVMVLVWHSAGVVNEGGFRALVEEGVPGDRNLERTADAYHTIGCPRAGNALRKAAAVLRHDRGREYADERMGRSVRRLAGLPAAEEKKFVEVLGEIEGLLAEYVRAHRDFFLTLDEEA
jgi:membrane associated rhomboid family serine protease